MKEQKVERGKTKSGADHIKYSTVRGPKSGPRQETAQDRKNYEDGYDRIFGNKKSKLEEPKCPLCKGEAEPGTCPCCNWAQNSQYPLRGKHENA